MSAQTVLSARERLSMLFDEGAFTEVASSVKSGDNLSGVVTAFGYVNENPVYAFAQDPESKKGALNAMQAKKLVKIYDLALKTGVPIVGIYDSYGADVSDATNALEGYGEWLNKASMLSGVVPQISLIAGVCASTAAMIAVSADFVVMAKDAELFITPNSEDKELSATALENGTAAIVCDDFASCADAVRGLVSRLPQNNISEVPIFEFAAPSAADYSDTDKCANSIFDEGSVLELYSGFGRSSYTALATLNGATVGVVATNKSEKKLNADDASKIARMVRTCDAFSIPVFTLVDTKGFASCEKAQKSGAVKQLAKVAGAYAEATTIKIAVILGKAYGSAFIVLAGKGANADLVYAVDSAVISSIEPLTAVEFLQHDKLKGADDVAKAREALALEYEQNEASAQKAAEKMAIDDVISKEEIRSSLISALEMMVGKRVSTLSKKHSNSPF
ncbi:MAG: carboxyl transferase [Ruminococcus sp.]|nr:carboxyl transferase [Ruminococcus sp.]